MQGSVKKMSARLGRLEARRQQILDEMCEVDRQLVETKEQIAQLDERWVELTDAVRKVA
jgi:hypothetical protein